MDQFTETELNKKYGNCYAKVVHNGTPYFVFIRSIEGGAIHCTVYLSNDSPRFSFPLAECEIISPPESKVFELGPHVVTYTHRPERQWRVGVNHDNSLFDFPMLPLFEWLSAGFHYAGKTFVPLEGKALSGLFYPSTFRTIGKAIKDLADGSYAKTLNDDWFLSLGLEPNTYLLWFFNMSIGVVSEDRKEIKLLFPAFEQEVRDLTNRVGEYYAVV